jgi:hypothetical protein
VTAGRVVLVMLAALVASGRAAREARAAEPAPIQIDLETCPPNWDPEIRLALAVELNDERLADARAERSRGHRVSIRCAEHRVWVVAHDAKTAATVERTLTGDLPEATAPRTIALVAADLLTSFDPALRHRLEAPAKPNQAPSPPSTSVATTAPSLPTESHRLLFTAGPVYRTFVSSAGIDAWGGALDARHSSRDGRWSAGADVEIAGGERSTTLGQTSALLVSARASAGVRVALTRDRLALGFDVGARAGAARMSGRAGNANVLASTAAHPWAGPLSAARIELGLSWFCAQLAAEAGWAAVSTSGIANGGTALAASGPWLAILLSVGVRP